MRFLYDGDALVADILLIERMEVMVPHRTELSDALNVTIKKNRGTPMANEKMTFILIKNEDGYPPDDTETMWVENLGNGKYRIDNIPFYIKDISPDDIIEGDCSTGRLFFKKLIKKSNISVIRVVFFNINKSDDVMDNLVKNGCRWEGSHLSNLYSVEIPDSGNLKKIKNFLDAQSSYGILDYEDASIRSS